MYNKIVYRILHSNILRQTEIHGVDNETDQTPLHRSFHDSHRFPHLKGVTRNGFAKDKTEDSEVNKPP